MMQRSDPIIMGMIGCKKNPKFAPKTQFPKAVLDLCKDSDELIQALNIVKHPEKVADICVRPENYPNVYNEN